MERKPVPDKTLEAQDHPPEQQPGGMADLMRVDAQESAQINDVTILFCGDSGDGMQLTGDQDIGSRLINRRCNWLVHVWSFNVRMKPQWRRQQQCYSHCLAHPEPNRSGRRATSHNSFRDGHKCLPDGVGSPSVCEGVSTRDLLNLL